jgi:hypothetical protein
MERNNENLIPPGDYPIILYDSPTFSRQDKYLKIAKNSYDYHYMLRIDIPGDNDHRLIHIGNFYIDSTGCLLTGSAVYFHDDITMQLINSKTAYKEIYFPIKYELENNEKVNINIKEIK